MYYTLLFLKINSKFNVVLFRDSVIGSCNNIATGINVTLCCYSVMGFISNRGSRARCPDSCGCSQIAHGKPIGLLSRREGHPPTLRLRAPVRRQGVLQGCRIQVSVGELFASIAAMHPIASLQGGLRQGQPLHGNLVMAISCFSPNLPCSLVLNVSYFHQRLV